MKSSPLISVIIPTFNRPDLLKRAVQSVIHQSYKNIEIIIVDDNSEVDLQEIGDLDSRIQLLRNERNRGANYSRNKGTEMAKGEFFNFLDDDDELYPEKLEKQLRLFRNNQDPSLAVVACDIIDDRNNLNITLKNRKSGYIYRDLLKSYCVYLTTSLLIKAQCFREIQGFDETLVANHEYDLCIRLAEKHTFDFIPEVLCINHASENQINSNFRKKLIGSRQMYLKHKKAFREEGVLGYNRLRFSYLTLKNIFGMVMGPRVYFWVFG